MSESLRLSLHSCMRHRAVWQVVNNIPEEHNAFTGLRDKQWQYVAPKRRETSTRQRDVTLVCAVTDRHAGGATCYT